jgi:hypothetical protein
MKIQSTVASILPTIVDREQKATLELRPEPYSVSGTLWFAGWLFTIGALQPSLWKAVLALVLWPYYLGLLFAK